MKSFPPLSYQCPIPWDSLAGDERERLCEKCGHTIVNLSLLSDAARAELIERMAGERLCVTYFRRLNGEYVTPATPLTAEERSRVKQLGLAVLSAGALALAAGCTTPPKPPRSDPAPSTPAQATSSKDEPVILQSFGIVGGKAPGK